MDPSESEEPLPGGRAGGAADQRGGDEAPGPTRAAWLRRADALALLVIAVACLFTYRGMLGHDPRQETPFLLSQEGSSEAFGGFSSLVDQQFVVWLVSRNARTWTTNPFALFDAEICHPTPSALALGEPGLTLGLLGAPVWLASGDPILTYNAVVVLVRLLAALAMYLLVRKWTEAPLAALVASLLYAFHPLQVSDTIHLYVPDLAATVFALFFFERWLERGRWRDATGLALATTAQIGGSLYPLLGAASLGLPFAVWGIARIGVGRTKPAQWALLLAGVSLATAGAFAPFVAKAASGQLGVREFQVFLPWSQLFGSDGRALGWPLLALAAVAFLPGRSAVRRDPRWALFTGATLALLLATGGNAAARMLAVAQGEPPPPTLPNLFAGLAALIPGLSSVRLPAAIAHASVPALAALAGLGAARLLAFVPAPLRNSAGGALLALALFVTLWPGLPGGPTLGTRSLRPPAERLAFFEALAAKGNQGAILEVPNPSRPSARYGESILLAAYHGRRTSSCYNSFLPDDTLEVERIAKRLPEPAALQALSDHDFTTLVLHHRIGERDFARLRDRLDEATRSEAATLRRLHRDDGMSAYAIDAPPASRTR